LHFVTQIRQDWNQLVSELKKWEQFGVEVSSLGNKEVENIIVPS